MILAIKTYAVVDLEDKCIGNNIKLSSLYDDTSSQTVLENV